MAACAQGRKVRFFRVTELITLLLEAKEERQLLRMRQQLGKLHLLILDELGYVPASKAGAELLFDIIATAYERNSLIVTTNLPSENWTEVLGSERLTGAALDRLTHRCHILETKVESYRLQDAKRRRRSNGYHSANALELVENLGLRMQRRPCERSRFSVAASSSASACYLAVRTFRSRSA